MTLETAKSKPGPLTDAPAVAKNDLPENILKAAWALQNAYDGNAELSVQRHRQLREWVIILGVIATLLAILSDITGTGTKWTSAHPWIAIALRILLVIVPITSSVILAMANKFQEGERWLALRTGAENILRVICIYATILSENSNRDQWLQERLAEIRRETLQKVTGNLALSENLNLKNRLRTKMTRQKTKDYLKSLLDQQKEGTLKSEDYITNRLTQAIKEYSGKIQDTQKQRTRMQAMILTLGGIGSLLAALANKDSYTGLGIWVAFSTAIAVALGSWLELRQTDWRVLRGMSSEEREKVYSLNSEKAGSNSAIDDPLETTVAVYSHIINELSIARDHWLSIKAQDRDAGGEFYELVLLVERILWGKDFPIDGPIQESINQAGKKKETKVQSSSNTGSSAEKAAPAAEGVVNDGPAEEQEATSFTDFLRKVPAQVTALFGGKKDATGPAMNSKIDKDPQTASDQKDEKTPTDKKDGQPIPSEQKPASSGRTLPPAEEDDLPKHVTVEKVKKERKIFVLMPEGRPVTSSGLKIDFENVYNRLVIEALKEKSEYSVKRWDKSRPDRSVQELLLADVVIADVGVNDPDVFYNLAVRHALRKYGIIHIREAQARSSFETFNVRTTEYHCNKFGRIDAAKEAGDQAALKNLVFNVSDSHAEDNPLFNFLPSLREPNQKDLKAPSAVDIWSEDDARRERIALVQGSKRTGDILVLADEIVNPMIQEDAYMAAGQALKELGRHDLALTWFRRGRELNPRSLGFRREEAAALNHLNRRDEAIEILENLLDDNPGDLETIINLVRVYKGKWYDNWKGFLESEQRRWTAYKDNHWLIKIFETYLNGYRYDLNRTHLAINAFTLGTIFVNLSEAYDPDVMNGSQVSYVSRVKNEILPDLQGTLNFALESKARKEKVDYDTLAQLAELQLMSQKSGPEVQRAYRRALMGTRRTRIAMQSTLRQLEMIYQLDLPGVCAKPGIDALRAELGLPAVEDNLLSSSIIQSETQERDKLKPRIVFFYESKLQESSSVLRGSSNQEVLQDIACQIEEKLKSILKEADQGSEPAPEIVKAIQQTPAASVGVLASQETKSKDDHLAITTGMQPGLDTIFVECCAKLGIKVEIYFPVSEEIYVEKYVKRWGEEWIGRFYKNRNHRLVDEYYQDTSLGDSKTNLFRRNTLWAKTYAELDAQEYRLVTIKKGTDSTKDAWGVSITDGSSSRYSISE